MTMNADFLTIDISKLKSAEPALENYTVDGDLMVVELGGDSMEVSKRTLNLLAHPLRFDGYLIFFCVTGGFRLEINLKTYDLGPGSMVGILPGSIVRMPREDAADLFSGRTVVFGVSISFASSLHIDLSKIFSGKLGAFTCPFVKLDSGHLKLGKEFLELGNHLMSMPLKYKKEALGSLISSIVYTAVDLWKETSPAEGTGGVVPTRQSMVFDRFMALVSEYHTRERGMAFYAGKLSLTPKYLSKIVRQASGRSAPDWIDSYVILEAKHMLRYSDSTIKEIVFRLNFPNQSVFYKFFKAHTGITPSEYRRNRV